MKIIIKMSKFFCIGVQFELVIFELLILQQIKRNFRVNVEFIFQFSYLFLSNSYFLFFMAFDNCLAV